MSAKVATQQRINCKRVTLIKQALTSDWNAWDVDGFMSPILTEFPTTWRVVDTLTSWQKRASLWDRKHRLLFSFLLARCPLLTLPLSRSNSVHSGCHQEHLLARVYPRVGTKLRTVNRWKPAIGPTVSPPRCPVKSPSIQFYGLYFIGSLRLSLATCSLLLFLFSSSSFFFFICYSDSVHTSGCNIAPCRRS